MAALPNSLLTVTLTSNFGTFILYALSCFLCIVAYHKRPDYSFLRHMLIPGFGLLANLVCMAFYVAGPFLVLAQKWDARLIRIELKLDQLLKETPESLKETHQRRVRIGTGGDSL